MANVNYFAADESDDDVSGLSSPFLLIPKPTSFTSNNPYNLQTIYLPTVPQSKFRLPSPDQTIPALTQTLRDAGLTFMADLLEETKSEHKTEYDLQALMDAVLANNDNVPGSTTSAAWELFRVMDGAIRKVLHTRKALREANSTFDADCDNLRANNHVLHNQIASLRERLTDSQLACATALASQTRAIATKSLAKDPTAFDASEKDAIKRNTEYENWRSKILIRLAQDSHEFTDELKKVLHIASLLTGSAWQSVQKGVTTILDNPTDQGRWTWASGVDLLAALDRTYRNFDAAAEADKRLTLLNQKDEYSVFTDFITEFVTLCDRAEIDDATRVRYLRDKINARIRKATVMQNPQPDRADWPGWLKLVSSLAKNIEHDEFQAKAHQHQGNKHNNNNGTSTPNNNKRGPKEGP